MFRIHPRYLGPRLACEGDSAVTAVDVGGRRGPAVARQISGTAPRRAVLADFAGFPRRTRRGFPAVFLDFPRCS